MKYLLLLVIVLCAMGNNLLKSIFAKESRPATAGDNAVYNVIACGIGAPLSLIGRGFGPAGGKTLLFALAFGISMACVAIFTIRALHCGPMALTSLFSNFSMVIPILFGFLFWKESVTLLKLAGIAAMFVAVFLIISPEKGEKLSGEWAVNVGFYFLSCGLMALFQQIAAKAVPEQSGMFLFYGFTFATAAVSLYCLCCMKNPATAPSLPFFCRENLNGLLVGIIGGISHISALKILTLMDSTVYYPLKDGVCIICNALLGYFLFRERITGRRLSGFILGAAAVIALTLVR